MKSPAIEADEVFRLRSLQADCERAISTENQIITELRDIKDNFSDDAEGFYLDTLADSYVRMEKLEKYSKRIRTWLAMVGIFGRHDN